MMNRQVELHMSRRCRNASPHAARPGFTLIELLVVIGLIVLLVALTVSVSTAVAEKSEVRQIETAMQNLNSAVQEYELAADRRITFLGASDPNGNASLYYDIEEAELEEFASAGPDDPPGSEDDFEITHELLELLDRKQSSRNILRSIPGELLYTESEDEKHSHLQTRDPWGIELITVFPGREWDSNLGDMAGNPIRDEDGTIRTEFEEVFGVARNKKLFFVSAGPDGQFGNLHLDTPEASLSAAQRDDIQRAADNVYSSDISRKRP